jgi:PAS domain S-box-containing protein
LFASLLLTLVPVGVLVTAMPALTVPGRSLLQDWDFIAVIGGAIFWAVAYGLSRVGRYKQAAGLSIGIALVAIFVATVPDVDAENANYLIMPLLVGMLFLPTKTNAILVTINTVGILLLPLLNARVTWMDILVGPMCFNLIGFVLTLLSARHRDQLERDRQAVLAEGEARYRSLFEATFEGVAVLVDGVLLDVNGGFARMFGYTASEAIGRSMSDFCQGEGVRDLQTERPYEVLGRRKDGSTFYVEMVAKAHTFQGHAAHVLAVRDITERKRAEEAMLQASRLEATATLAGGIAHKVNNMMVGVLGYAELLRADLADCPDAQDMLDTISRSAQKAGDLALQMLAFAHGGRHQPRAIDLNDIIRQVIQLQRRSLPVGICMQLDAAPDLWPVTADPMQVSQVLLNLLTNAVESIADDGLITVTTKNVMADETCERQHPSLNRGSYVCMSVQDSGCGMNDETLSRAFDPFFTTKFEGRGMGLAVVYGIVNKHGGYVATNSQPGRGTMFQVYLPAA